MSWRIHLKGISVLIGSLWACAAVFVSGCDSSTTKWREQVELKSGQILTVSRSMTFRCQQPFGGQGTCVETAGSLEVLGADDVPVWSEPTIPLLLDKDPSTGSLVLVATMENCETWEQRGQPRPPYWAFVVAQNGWRAFPMPEPFYGRVPNLMIQIGEALNGRAVTAAQKRSTALVPYGFSIKYQSINRATKSNCMPATINRRVATLTSAMKYSRLPYGRHRSVWDTAHSTCSGLSLYA
jgi:hypothetical protein